MYARVASRVLYAVENGTSFHNIPRLPLFMGNPESALSINLLKIKGALLVLSIKYNK